MKIKKTLTILICFLVFGCSSEKPKMTDSEQYLANKFNAERISLDFITVKTEMNGKLTEDRKFISITLTNTDDMEKIMTDDNYSNERGMRIATFVIDSLQFNEMPFQPKELEIDFISESGFFLLSNEKNKTINYDLN